MWSFAAPQVRTPGHTIVSSVDQLEPMVAELRAMPSRGFDFETDGLRYANGDKPIGFSVGHMWGVARPRAWYVPVGHLTAEPQIPVETAKRAFRDALNGSQELIGHNPKFDLNMARADGWDIPDAAFVHCTLVQAYLAYEKRFFQLEKLVATDVPGLPWNPFEYKEMVDGVIADRCKAHKLGKKAYMAKYGHAEVPVAIEGEYSCRDVAHTLMLDRANRPKAMGQGTWYEARRRHLYNNEMELVRALADMEYAGQPIDVPYLQRFGMELDQQLADMEKQLAVAFNATITWTNDNTVRDLLFRHMRLPVFRKTEHGVPSIDRAHLLMLRPYFPAIDLLAEYNAHEKVRSTYTDSLIGHVCRDGKIHGSFKQHGAGTGRLSSADPNLQNIPARHKTLARRVRAAFVVPSGGARIFCDYSQVELRILAWATGCATLLGAYRSPAWEGFMRGECGYDGYREQRHKEATVDVHAAVAQSVFGAKETDTDWKRKRSAAKIINFGVPYGMGWAGLNSNPELMLPEEQAKQLFAQYHQMNPEIARTKHALFRKMLMERGAPKFINWAGRSVHGPGLRSGDEGQRAESERSMFASLIQGSAAELTRFSLVRLWRAARTGKLPATVTSTVHDEVQLDCDAVHAVHVGKEVQRVMEDFHGLFGAVPIVAELESTTTNWADKHKLETTT